MLKNADVNFDEYDKSDDPQDYKFVRWLTKEKVLHEFPVTLNFHTDNNCIVLGLVNMLNVICHMLNPRPYSNLGSKVPCVGVGVGAQCWGWFFLRVNT